MTARSFLLHGVTVGLDSELPYAMAEALLARFPEEPAGPRAARIAVELRFDRRPETHADSRATPLFFHGAVRAWSAGEEVELRADGALLRVARDGRSIRGCVHPRLAEAPHAFANVPLLIALALALRPHGLFHLHAAANVVPDLGGVLMPGAAASGKSTLSLALLTAGARWLGDDATLVGRLHGAGGVFSFPKPFHVAERSARAHPALEPFLTPFGAPGKWAFDPRKAFPGLERDRIGSPDVVLLPTIADAPRTVIVEASRAEVLGALIESSAMLAVDGMAGVREQLASLAALANAPCRARVLLGRDLLEDPRACVDALVRTLSGRTAARAS